ncbi:hypothetical protein ACGFYP_01145 [Streptomyces sp. NPDC048370]|uniref:hypothetical protein n=1 Tax=Streptomyces sp. NPDC048370 TaxID=3365540 RepID=UPI0037143CD9
MSVALFSPPVYALTLLAAVLAAALLSLLVAVGAGLLAHWDGASLPGALFRAGTVFGAAMTLLCGLIALGVAATT